MTAEEESRGGELASVGERREQEGIFAHAFVRAERRERFLSTTSSRAVPHKTTPKALKRWRDYSGLLVDLCEFWAQSDLIVDPGGASAAAELTSPSKVARLLKEHRAPAECYVMSMKGELDGRFMGLEEALKAVCVFDEQYSILVCSPQRLAFYRHGEMVSLSRLLVNASGKN